MYSNSYAIVEISILKTKIGSEITYVSSLMDESDDQLLDENGYPIEDEN